MNSFEYIKKAISEVVGNDISFSLDMPEETSHGDYATNVAFILAKQKSISTKACADELAVELQNKLSDIVEKIEVADAGFVNFTLKDEVRTKEALSSKDKDLKLNFLSGKKVICEYTDPNPFKLFHIGHLVPNTIGESIARIYESVGANVVRVNYQGDVGMHVAITLWGIKNMEEKFPDENIPLNEKVAYLGRAYAYGTNKFAENPELKNQITEINKSIFAGEKSEAYDLGRRWSLDYFETIYEKLGTKFDYYIFESEVSPIGKELVKKNIDRVFEESDGAIVYKGEKAGLHTRVFINREGLPTYEAKEIGNAFHKQELIPDNDISIIVTANEINEYFKVIKSALSEIDKNLSDKIKHISHGMLRLPTGKMSSRTGDVIPAEELIDEVKEKLKDKFDDARIEGSSKEKLINDVAVAAIKFSILKIAPGKDIIFDIDKSISFEGDSGPYLQYTHARLTQLILKCESAKIVDEKILPEIELERIINNFSNILERSYKENAPQHIVTYLTELTRAFNSFYGRVRIISEEGIANNYYIDLCKATKNILHFGLYTLGIVAPEEM
jgi:arginyl-tRNA synthetase